MNIQLPPALFYGVGTMLIVFGALRAIYLGWQRRPAKAPEKAPGEESLEDVEVARDGKDARRHIMFGILWVAMGLFLVISTFLNSRGR
jgi:uncharacterized membrane protein HdeD (DUF308 family)